MDEHTLNDLLECSVCLERLDTSSKVLPCQHTFCRKCLEVIVSSRNELRCPECRVLVNIKIDDLPPNVLLMRILEGMKNSKSPQTNNSQLLIDNKKDNMNIKPRINNPSIQQSIVQNSQLMRELPTGSHTIQQQSHQSANSSTQQQQQLKIQPNFNQQQNKFNQLRRCHQPHAYALFDFQTNEISDLKFKKGDLILLKRKIDINWYIGQLNGIEGNVPINYVQVIVPLPSPQCIALYDFKMATHEEEGCLTFKKGTIINVLRRVDHNWAEGRISNNIGIFPIAFVELNPLAKQMLDSCTIPSTPPPITTATTTSMLYANSDISSSNRGNLPPLPQSGTDSVISHHNTISKMESPSNSSSSSAITSPINSSTTTTTMSSNGSYSSPSSNATSPNHSLTTTPQQIISGSSSVRYRDNREKRHSLNTLLTTSANGTSSVGIMLSNRHSAEILSVPTELNTNASPSQSTILSQNVRQKPSTDISATIAVSNEESLNTSSSINSAARINVLTTCGQQNLPTTLPWGYLALYPYKPRKNDELELKKGCVYIVTEHCQDGWFKGKNWQDITGVFPGNYVTPLRTRDQQQLMHQWKYVPLQNSSAGTSKAANNLPHQPPDLPPRYINNGNNSFSGPFLNYSSVWTKPLNQKVEAFFCRHSEKEEKDSHKDKECKQSKENNSSMTTTSCSSSAVSLMKRITNIKSRSKSPNIKNGVNLTNNLMDNLTVDDTMQTTPQTVQAIHVRSGSCPSQLLQTLPSDHQPSSQATYGSKRIKGNKERPSVQIPISRQSMNETLRNIPTNIGLPPAPPLPIIPIQQNNNQIFNKCWQQQQQMHSNVNNAIYHRKSQSLDANTVLMGAPQHITSAAITASATTKSSQYTRESRFRCVVPYPPNSDIELELHIGDIIYVQRKQKNGWYKGTHARTNKTGLFPASFVEPDL